MDGVVASDSEKAAIDAAVNARQAAVLLAARMEADQRELRDATDRAATTLAALKPKEER